MKIIRYLLMVTIVGCSSSETTDRTGFASKLIGHWQAEAFSGLLSEYWTLEPDGWLLQDSYYIEDDDTTYRAKSRILSTGDKWVLYSIIEGNDPKIFQADVYRGDSLVFLNNEYSNPSRVSYSFISDHQYNRRISGIENDEQVSYLLKFEKVR